MLKRGVCSKIIDSLATLAAAEVKKTGKFVIPGVAMLKTRVKPATKAGKREIFGKEVMVKAKPAKTVVSIPCVSHQEVHLEQLLLALCSVKLRRSLLFSCWPWASRGTGIVEWLSCSF